MTAKVTSDNEINHQHLGSSPKITKEDLPKATKVFKKEISDPVQTSKDEEREYFISKVMKEKNVSRDVAEAEYDFFG